MTRQEYLSELDSNLMSLSSEERENAVRFYEEYFEDAGPENEQTVMEELGKPFALAKSIICEQSEYSKSRSYAKYRESKELGGNAPSGTETPAGEPDVMPGRAAEKPHTQYTAYNYGAENAADKASSAESAGNTASGSYNSAYEGSYDAYKENYQSSYSGNTYSSYSSGGADLSFAVGLILGIIFGLPLVLMLTFFFIACGFASLALAVGTIVCLIVGAAHLATSFGVGMMVIGMGIFLAGASLLALIPTVLGFGKFMPWVARSVSSFFKKHAKGVI